MKLKVLNSRSQGNCYILYNDTSALIIEAGVPYKEIQKALGFEISKIIGVLISHEHGDHSSKAVDFVNRGHNIYASLGTLQALNIDYYKLSFPIKAKTSFNIEEFKVLPFDIVHDAAEPFGYLIRHEEMGTCLFLTDSHYSPFKFPGLTQVMVECNYDQQILDENILNGRLPVVVRKRTMESHISIQTCKELLKANDLSKVQNIVLLHLSDGNSNARQFKDEIQGITGKRTFIAEKGLDIDFNINPF
jgi:phosphoribosyl 1,2-cyclic phosphodiesterase